CKPCITVRVQCGNKVREAIPVQVRHDQCCRFRQEVRYGFQCSEGTIAIVPKQLQRCSILTDQDHIGIQVLVQISQLEHCDILIEGNDASGHCEGTISVA